MLPQKEDEALQLFFLSCGCSIVTGFFCAIVCALAPATMNGLMTTHGVWPLALMVLAVVVGGLRASVHAWCVRVKAFKATSISQVVSSVCSNGVKIGSGVSGAVPLSLIVSIPVADLAASFSLAGALSQVMKAPRPNIEWARMRQLARDYSDFPKYAASKDVMNSLSQGLPVLALGHFFGIAAAGAYSFAMTVLGVPMGVVQIAVRQVLFQKACESEHRGRGLSSLYLMSTIGLLTLAAMPSLILFFWAPQIFAWLFGRQWDAAGAFARSLIVWLSFAFCNLPAGIFGRLIRIQRRLFFYDVGLLVARGVAMGLGGLYLTASETVFAFSLVGAGMNVFLILLVGRAVLRREGHERLNTAWQDL